MKPITTSLGSAYLTLEEFDTCPAKTEGRVLGAIAFGANEPTLPSLACPFAYINMPLVTGGTAIEVWTSDKPVIRDDDDDITASRSEDFLFGCLTVEEDGTIDALSYAAYCRIFDFLESRGYRHLLRIWNYFSRINEDADGLERYRGFSMGRHDAFAAKSPDTQTENAPAACALGSQDGPIVIYFLAAKNPGQPIENPRQTSAYHYPAQYGPRSPTFSRAMVARGAKESLLFISGTASIVGHASVHIGNVSAQTRETITNLRTLIDQASFINGAFAGNGNRLMLKAYLRQPEYLPIVQEQLRMTFGPTMEAIYLQADICRSDLLLEVEGLCISAIQEKSAKGNPW